MQIDKEESVDKIIDGFQINWMKLRDVETGEVLWGGNEDLSAPDGEHIIKIPKKILLCKEICREINFSSLEPITRLRLEQSVTFKGRNLEKWSFEYGEVAPCGTDTWKSRMFAAPESQMMPVNILSGNIVVETKFFDGDNHIATSRVRLYYI